MSEVELTVAAVNVEKRPAGESLLGTEDGFSVEHVRDRVDTSDVATVGDTTADCIVVGETAGDSEQETLVRQLSTERPDVPIVATAAGEDVAALVDAGATDVVGSPPSTVDDALLATRVSNVVGQHQERETANERAQRLQSLLVNSSDRVSVLQPDGTYAFVSPAMERLMGHDPETLLGDSAFQFVHPEDRDFVQQKFAEIRQNPGQTLSVEYRFEDGQGDYQWVESRGKNLLDDPTVEGILINTRNITERKERETELKEEQALTEAIFSALPEVFYLFDEQMNFLRWNDRLSEVSGYSDDEIDTMHPVEFIAPDDHVKVYDAIERVMKQGETQTIEANFETKDGTVIPYEVTGAQMVGENGKATGLVGIGRNVTRRKERKRRFEAVFNNTYQFTGLTDPDGTLVEVNDAAREFGGLERSDVVGKYLWDAYWFQVDEETRQTAREAVEQAREGSFYRTEVEVQGADRTEIIDFSVRPITDDDGEVTMLIPEGRTITGLKKRERQLSVLQRFLRHNLRNKMTVIKGNADLLDREAELPGTQQRHVHQIQDAAAELTELSETAHELSQLTNRSDATNRPVDVSATLRDLAASVREAYPDASVSVDAPVDVTASADWRLSEVFDQLVENAIEHADHEDPNVDLTVTERVDGVDVAVGDNGPGIPDDEFAGIVNDDVQTQLTHGTGFGLWLVQSIVRDYGGELSYDQSASGGSVVTVHLHSAQETA